MTRGLTAEDITVKTKVVSEIPVRTYCDLCLVVVDACILLQNWMHGSLYVCPDCRAMACVKTESELLAEQIAREDRAEKERKENAKRC